MAQPMNILSGSVLKKHLHVGVKRHGLLGKICVEMLEEAKLCAAANSGVVSDHSVVHRLMSCLRLTFGSLDYIGCEINNNDQSDFERIDVNILLAKTGQSCVDKANWLRDHYCDAYIGYTKFEVRLMSIWNDFKHSAPSNVTLQVYDGAFYYVIGEVWLGVNELVIYVEKACAFAKEFFQAMGFQI